MARFRRWRLPTERFALGAALPGSSNASSSRSAAARGSCSPSSRANSSRFSRAERRPYCAVRCGAQPTRAPLRRSTVPTLASSAPASSASSVDLPAPFGPTSASASPSQSSSSTGSSALVWPNRRAAPRAASSGVGEAQRLAAAGGSAGGRGATRVSSTSTSTGIVLSCSHDSSETRSPKNSQIARPAASSGSATSAPGSP